VGGGFAGGGLDAGRGAADALVSAVLASTGAPPPSVSAVLASIVASVPTSGEAASSMGPPSSPDAGPAVVFRVTFGGTSPPKGEASSLPHPQGPAAAQARAATVTH
jgi:hypothetical protein